MTTQNQIRISFMKPRFTNPVTWLVKHIINTIQQSKKRAEYQKTYRHLATQPDYILKDAGITRAELNVKLDKPWWWS
jgi:uncharacterized protein YjiS (DUF1127 family)